MRPHGRARISPTKPQAQAVCDRCYRRLSHSDLSWQFEFAGPQLQNLRILVCRECLDKPQEGLRTLILPPDPVPIENPRPENFVSDDNPISPLGFDVTGMYNAANTGANTGNMTGGGGLDAPFWGADAKPSWMSALGPGSAGNIIKNFSYGPGPTTPSSLSTGTLSYSIQQVVLTSPSNALFGGGGGKAGPCVLSLNGSSNGSIWTTIASANVQGVNAEVITLYSSNFTGSAGPWPYVEAVLTPTLSSLPTAISKFDIYVTGSTGAGELGGA
jgi:hypothetical protein